MKRLFIILITIAISISSNAQEFKKIKIGIGLGYGSGLQGYDSPTKSGAVLLYFEPSYRVNDKIALAARFEAALGDLVIGSYGANAQYYFSNKSFRPFAGLGFGLYHPGFNYEYPTFIYSTNEETKLGFYPRIGFDYGHFTMAAEYNIVGSSKVTIHSEASTSGGYLESQYFSFKIGWFISGGRKK